MNALPWSATLAQSLDFIGFSFKKGSRVAEFVYTYRGQTHIGRRNMCLSPIGFRKPLPTLPATLRLVMLPPLGSGVVYA